jgi:hypothetical protein
MGLNIIAEERFETRVKRALLGQGKTDRIGVYGIVDEFGVDTQTAVQYLQGYYGEDGIEDKFLHRIRAPQAIHKLLKHYDISPIITKKLIRFHVDNFKTISKHQPSPSDEVTINQMHRRERLAALVRLPLESLRESGFLVQPYITTPPITSIRPAGFYIAWPGDEDIIEEMSEASGSGGKLDLLHGLAFGYRMVDVLNYLRSDDKQLIDNIVGNTNSLSKN